MYIYIYIYTGQSTQPRFALSDHQAAVKALAWCPWQNNLLASGGGTSDRCIRFWNTTTGKCLNTIDTNSQVCSLLWSKTHKEIVSSHGFSQNQLCIWKVSLQSCKNFEFFSLIHILWWFIRDDHHLCFFVGNN